jgi:hypothetical protein
VPSMKLQYTELRECLSLKHHYSGVIFRTIFGKNINTGALIAPLSDAQILRLNSGNSSGMLGKHLYILLVYFTLTV